MSTKICPKCRQKTEFYNNAVWCKGCLKTYYQQRHADKYTDVEYRMQRLCSAIKRRAVKKGLEFTLTTQDLISMYPEDSRCPVFGVEMIFGNGEYSPSLDRIDSTKGYTKENCMFMCKKANTIKSNATFEEIVLVYEFMRGSFNGELY